MHPLLRAMSLGAVVGLAACDGTPEDTATGDDTPVDRGPKPEAITAEDPGPPTLRRLTSSQLSRSIHDLLGDVTITGQVEPDIPVDGSLAIGSATTTISNRGVEQQETLAFDVAAQVAADADLLDAVLPCAPSGAQDEACMRELVDTFGMRAWRRPLSKDESDRVLDVAMDAAETLGTFATGAEFAIATVLQSPNFVFREELGEERDGARWYTDYELASKLAFFLWDTIPDDALLEAAGKGELSTTEGLTAQVDRMLADDRAREGVLAVFEDAYELYDLPKLSKDPNVFEHMSGTVGESARTQTLMDLAWLIFEEEGDFRDIFTTRTTHIDRELASIYGVAAPAREGFARTELPEDGRRRGLLGQLSFVGLHAHPTSSSATLRGKALRERVLCHPIPPPPAGVDTSIPEPGPDAVTLRDRIQVHLESPACAGCHQITDPVGLALENFDGLARWRTKENGGTIDPSGDLDGTPFTDAWDLARVIREHEDTPRCVVDHFWTAAMGRRASDGETANVAWLEESFAWHGYKVKNMLTDLVTSESFRKVGDLAPEVPE